MFLVDYLWDSMVEFLYEVLILNGGNYESKRFNKNFKRT